MGWGLVVGVGLVFVNVLGLLVGVGLILTGELVLVL